jgi:hypothetical protein
LEGWVEVGIWCVRDRCTCSRTVLSPAAAPPGASPSIRHHVCLPNLAWSRSTLTTHISAEGGGTRRSHLGGNTARKRRRLRPGVTAAQQPPIGSGADRRLVPGALCNQELRSPAPGGQGGQRDVAPPRRRATKTARHQDGAPPRRRLPHAWRLASEHMLQLHPLVPHRHHAPRDALPRRALLPLEARAHGCEHDAQLARREVLIVGHHPEGDVPHVAPRRRLDGAPGALQPRLVRVSARAKRHRWGRRRHGEWEC